jgi:hypothetical protein
VDCFVDVLYDRGWPLSPAAGLDFHETEVAL